MAIIGNIPYFQKNLCQEILLWRCWNLPPVYQRVLLVFFSKMMKWRFFQQRGYPLLLLSLFCARAVEALPWVFYTLVPASLIPEDLVGQDCILVSRVLPCWATGWCPPVISWFINPINYSYKYHKP